MIVLVLVCVCVWGGGGGGRGDHEANMPIKIILNNLSYCMFFSFLLQILIIKQLLLTIIYFQQRQKIIVGLLYITDH